MPRRQGIPSLAAWCCVVCLVSSSCGRKPAPVAPQPSPPRSVSADLASLAAEHPLWSRLERIATQLEAERQPPSDPALAPEWRDESGDPADPTNASHTAAAVDGGEPTESTWDDLRAQVERGGRPPQAPPVPDETLDGSVPRHEQPGPRVRASETASWRIDRDRRLRGEMEGRGVGRAPRGEDRSAAEAAREAARLRLESAGGERPPTGGAAGPPVVGPSPSGVDWARERALRLRELEAELDAVRLEAEQFARSLAAKSNAPTPTPFTPTAPFVAGLGGAESAPTEDVAKLAEACEALRKWLLEDTARTARVVGASLGYDVTFGASGSDSTVELREALRRFYGGATD